jgi:hypothetical protein
MSAPLLMAVLTLTISPCRMALNKDWGTTTWQLAGFAIQQTVATVTNRQALIVGSS